VYSVIDEVRAVALGGGNAVLLLDTLDGLHEHAARRALAIARKLVDGGSVTLIATSTEPLGGETTVIALDPALPGANRFPPLDPRVTGTLRAESLVGETGAAKLATERTKRLKRIAR
jgi:transcription termination factor Rho